MVLLALALATAGPKLPPPAFVAGDEIVYAGVIHETSERSDLTYRRRTVIEVRLFVLSSAAGSADVAVMTSLTPQDDPAISSAVKSVVGHAPEESAAAVRLVLVRVDARGRVRLLKPPTGLPMTLSPRTPMADPPALPVESAAAVELGAFIPRPEEPPTVGTAWDAGVRWAMERTAVWGGAEVIEVAGTQQSAEWGRSAPGKAGWKRSERVWVSPADGLVRVLHRTVERADGPTKLGSVAVRFEMTDPPTARRGESYNAIRREIEHAVAFADVTAGGKAAALAKLDRFRRDNSPASFRPAVDAVARRLGDDGKVGK